MAKLPLHLAACGINGAQRAPIRLCLIGGEIGAAVVSMAHFVGLWRGAEDVALLSRRNIKETGSRVEAWGHPVGGAERSRANRPPLRRWRTLLVRDGTTLR